MTLPAKTIPTSPASFAEEGALVLRPDIMERMVFQNLFPSDQAVELELGAGDGSFLVKYAALNPNTNLIGVERLLGRLRKIDKKGRQSGLANLRCMRLEASYVLEWMIAAESLTALHIYFPDPWPKRRHWPRRLINTEFTRQSLRALKPGGAVYVRTDESSYFKQMNQVFDANSQFRRKETPPELLALETDFEAMFHAKGIPTLHAAWEKS